MSDIIPFGNPQEGDLFVGNLSLLASGPSSNGIQPKVVWQYNAVNGWQVIGAEPVEIEISATAEIVSTPVPVAESTEAAEVTEEIAEVTEAVAPVIEASVSLIPGTVTSVTIVLERPVIATASATALPLTTATP